jgi:predicted GIY-YIG superfamily endonuclease
MSTTLYRAYDAAGRLLYVGITDKLVTARLIQHALRDRRGFTAHMAAVHVTRYSDRETAIAAESAVIRDENPVFNVAGRPSDHQWVAYPDRYADDATGANLEEHRRKLLLGGGGEAR